MILEQETEAILGAVFEVSNVLGPGLNEKVYENALAVEFGIRGIPVEIQPRFPVTYKECQVGNFIPDMIVFDRVIVDTKTIQGISDRELGQMLNYLQITKLKVGLIVNFKYAKVAWKRVICDARGD